MSLTRYSCRVIFIASCLLAWRLSPELSGQENRTTNAQGESQKTVGDAKPNLLTGRFVIDGEPAERKRIDANYGAHALLKSLPVGALEETLIVGEDRGIANVFVYVRSKDIPFDKPQERKAPTKVSVVKGQFSPHALAVQSPRKLLFENSAEAPINVRTQFLNNVNQNRVVATGQNFEIALKPEKIPVQYNCDIYPWMHGWILV